MRLWLCRVSLGPTYLRTPTLESRLFEANFSSSIALVTLRALNASKVTPATSIGQNAPGVRCKPASKTVNQAEHKLTGVKNQLESLGS